MIIFNEEKKNKFKHIELNPEQIDVLMEIGNIGSGNAITALSELLNRRIEVSIEDLTTKWSMLSLQGPHAKEVLTAIIDSSALPKPFRNYTRPFNFKGAKGYIARTGYTGEPIGFEIFLPTITVVSFWESLIVNAYHSQNGSVS